MPLFSIQIKIMNTTLIITIIIVLVLYFAVAMAYAMKIDNVLYYKYPTMERRDFKKLIIYCFFWTIFFVELDKIIKEKK